MKVWNAINGECVFEFASVHGSSCITAADIDYTGRRLGYTVYGYGYQWNVSYLDIPYGYYDY